jgi:hypothetical protein
MATNDNPRSRPRWPWGPRGEPREDSEGSGSTSASEYPREGASPARLLSWHPVKRPPADPRLLQTIRRWPPLDDARFPTSQKRGRLHQSCWPNEKISSAAPTRQSSKNLASSQGTAEWAERTPVKGHRRRPYQGPMHILRAIPTEAPGVTLPPVAVQPRSLSTRVVG